MKFGEWFFGKSPKIKKQQTATPEAMQAMQQVWQALQLGQGPFGDLYGQYDPSKTTDYFQRGVQEPAMRNFQQSIIPSIMQSFADQGASSGLNQTLATAGRNLEADLSSQLANMQYAGMMQNQQNRMQGLQNVQNFQPYAYYNQQGSQGFLPGMISNFSQGAGQSFNPWGWLQGMLNQNNPMQGGAGRVGPTGIGYGV